MRKIWVHLPLAATLLGPCAAEADTFEKASDAVMTLVGDYAGRPVCGEPSPTANEHRVLARQALAQVNEPGRKDVLGNSPLQYAVVVDDLEAVHRFEALGYSLTAGRDGTLLFEAAMFATAPVTEYLLAQKIDVNATNDYGATALMVAAAERRPEMVDLLLRNGADASIHNRDSGTALGYALACGFTESARVLLDGGASIDQKSRQIAERHGIIEQLERYRARDIPAPAR
jgi:ankyrin repeat protein